MSEFRELRLKLGLTQNQLGDELGCSRKAIHEYETGKAPIPRARLLALRFLAEHPRELLTTRAPRRKTPAPARAGADRRR